MDRRSFLRTGTGAALLGAVGGLNIIGKYYDTYQRFYEPVIENARDLLSGSTTTDWAYQDGRAVDTIETMLQEATVDHLPVVAAREPTWFQSRCRDEYLVSSPEDSLMALFGPDGRLTGLHDGESHSVPFSGQPAEPSDAPYLPEGGLAGVQRDGETLWLSNDFETDDTAMIEQGIYRHVYSHPETETAIERYAYVPFGSEQLRMDYHVPADMDGQFIYYFMGNANTNYQNAMVYESEFNSAVTGVTAGPRDRSVSRMRSQESAAVIDLHVDESTDAGVMRANITDADRRDALDRTRYDPLEAIWSNLFDPAGVAADLGGEPFDLLAEFGLADLVEREPYDRFTPGGTLSDILGGGDSTAQGRYIAMIQSAPIDDQITVTLSGPQGDAAPAGSRQSTVKDWQAWRKALETDDLSSVDREMAADLAATAIKTYVGDGQWLAAPQMQPNYSRIWPRDACDAVNYAAALGLEDTAVDTVTHLGELMAKTDRGRYFDQCYDLDGNFNGLVGVEMDQMGLYVDTVYNVEQELETDLVTDAIIGSAVTGATAYLANHIADNDLIVPSHDYKEYPTDVNQSVWTNHAALRAFEQVTADPRLDLHYSDEAARIRSGMVQELADPDGDWAPNIRHDGTRSYDIGGMSADCVARLDWFGDIDIIIKETDFSRERDRWTVSDAERAKGLYQASRDGLADSIVDTLQAVMGHGTMPERVHPDGRYSDARHLTWAQANAGLALYRKGRSGHE
jgi:hypothetical protein